MIKNFLLLLCFIVSMASLSTNLQAQRGAAIPPLSDELKATLNLSDEQTEALETLRQETQQKMANQQAERRQLRENAQEELANILTTEQLEQLSQHQRAVRESQIAAFENVDHHALHAELKTYQQENIKPVKLAFRQQLDEQMTEEDRTALAEARNSLRENQRAQRAANRNEGQKARGKRGQRHHKPHRSHARCHHGGQPILLRDRYPEEWNTLENLINKYDTQLNDIFAEMNPLHEQWGVDMAAIKAKYLPESPAHNRSDHQEMDSERAESQDLMHKMHFLLMNPEEKEQQHETPSIGATAFPNPANETTTLAFDLPEADKIQILLNDGNGKIVQELADQFFEAGKHELAVALRGLQSGVYYISLNGDKTHETVRIVVSN